MLVVVGVAGKGRQRNSNGAKSTRQPNLASAVTDFVWYDIHVVPSAGHLPRATPYFDPRHRSINFEHATGLLSFLL